MLHLRFLTSFWKSVATQQTGNYAVLTPSRIVIGQPPTPLKSAQNRPTAFLALSNWKNKFSQLGNEIFPVRHFSLHEPFQGLRTPCKAHWFLSFWSLVGDHFKKKALPNLLTFFGSADIVRGGETGRLTEYLGTAEEIIATYPDRTDRTGD